MGKSKKRRASSSSDDSEDSLEQERKKDLKERDEFANRLKDKDKERTRNVARPQGSSGQYKKRMNKINKKSMKFRLFFLLEGRGSNKVDIEKLRLESRRKYLAKRKDDKISELEADIIDDEYLFNDVE